MVPGTTGTLFLLSDDYFHLNSDPDPAFHFHADPDPAPLQRDGRDHRSILSLQDSIVSVHGPRTESNPDLPRGNFNRLKLDRFFLSLFDRKHPIK